MTLSPSYHSSPRRGPPLRARPGPPTRPRSDRPGPLTRPRSGPTPPTRPRSGRPGPPARPRSDRPGPLTRPRSGRPGPRGALAVLAFALAVLALAALASCLPNGPPTGLDDARPPAPSPRAPADPADDPKLETAFTDDFERAEPGPAWRLAGPGWLVRAGRLCGEGNRNRGAWLARRLPPNARVEFDAVAETPRGDLKAEFWGDGTSGASGPSYRDATSYLLVFGGWRNTRHVLARLDEHDPARLELALDPADASPPRGRVRPGRAYHVRVERADGHTLTWHVDGALVASFDDPNPLTGPGHDHWGFNEWDAAVCFDNVRASPLP